MKRYVLGFLFSSDLNDVLLIQKTHPAQQAGKWNGLGGAIAEGETPEAAMTREFKEESGVHVPEWMKVGRLYGPTYEVFIFAAKGENGGIYRAMTQTDEVVRPWGMATISGNKIPMVSNVPMLFFMAKGLLSGLDNAVEYNIEEVSW